MKISRLSTIDTAYSSHKVGEHCFGQQVATKQDLLDLKAEISEKVYSATLRYGEPKLRRMSCSEVVHVQDSQSSVSAGQTHSVAPAVGIECSIKNIYSRVHAPLFGACCG